MSNEISITIHVPRYRIMVVRGCIYIIGRALRCRLIGEVMACMYVNRLSQWLANGLYVK